MNPIMIHITHAQDFGLAPSALNMIGEQAPHEALRRSGFLARHPEKTFELSLLLTDDAAIQRLNLEHRGKDKPTNVLSFPAYDSHEPHPPGAPIALGDIVLAYETIQREAKEQNKSLVDHVAHLIVHGVLHLIGHDHESDHEADHMESLEIEILETFGVRNPYEDD